MAGHAFSHRRRAIVNTDAKNEADDQFAIAHALLAPRLDIRGLVAAHFGNRRTRSSMEESRAEIDLLVRLMELGGTGRVEDGAPYALPVVVSPAPSPGEEAMRDVSEPLYVAFLGPLTDMASALPWSRASPSGT
ncbi:hypothetical protein [Nonomuraea jabiensis]|uniref:hypothetical protein n=1 Tax=Nonomuraea jabiensis TaxID=882448 RepID=UPI003D753043